MSGQCQQLRKWHTEETWEKTFAARREQTRRQLREQQLQLAEWRRELPAVRWRQLKSTLKLRQRRLVSWGDDDEQSPCRRRLREHLLTLLAAVEWALEAVDVEMRFFRQIEEELYQALRMGEYLTADLKHGYLDHLRRYTSRTTYDLALIMRKLWDHGGGSPTASSSEGRSSSPEDAAAEGELGPTSCEQDTASCSDETRELEETRGTLRGELRHCYHQLVLAPRTVDRPRLLYRAVRAMVPEVQRVHFLLHDAAIKLRDVAVFGFHPPSRASAESSSARTGSEQGEESSDGTPEDELPVGDSTRQQPSAREKVAGFWKRLFKPNGHAK